MKSKIYTLTGDNGTTALVGGKRVDKDSTRVEAYGTIDELNSYIGLLAHNSKLDLQDMPIIIRHIQHRLFNIGAYLATEGAATCAGLSETNVQALEAKIDEWDAQLPPMQGFILPGGSRLSAMCDICRTLSRRAERRVVTLSREAHVDPIVLKYLNRLSDFFFVFARFNNISNQVEEIYWDKNI